MLHLLCCPCESFTKIFFAKLLKSPFLQKFSDAKIPRYTECYLENFNEVCGHLFWLFVAVYEDKHSFIIMCQEQRLKIELI